VIDHRHAGIGMTSARTRERLIDRLRTEGIRDQRVLERVRQVPRHLFVDEALASRAYEDTALPIGHGQTISQPYVVARMTEALIEHGPLVHVLEIGTGSGYQTAILAPLVRRVYTVERVEALLNQARERFRTLQLRNIRTKYADGTVGLPEYGPYDGILVTAAPEAIPQGLVDQLRMGGRMVLPTGPRNAQALVRVTRTEGGHETELLERVVFVPLLGGVC
jgi:protein-L-isoaspartate(D-aspartate) O-methyltransferase